MFFASRALRATTITALLAAGCSLVNAFDDLAPRATPDASLDATPDAPESFDAARPVAPPGVVVVAGTEETDAGARNVLSALDPRTGQELPRARQAMKVAGLVYDPSKGADGKERDLFYIFENKGESAVPLPSDRVELHVRSIDRATGEWLEVRTLVVPPIVSHLFAVALPGRLVYVAYETTADGSFGPKLVLVDTSTPASTDVVQSLSLTATPLGLVGAPGPGGPGGNLGLFGRRSLGQGRGVATLTPYLISAIPSDPIKPGATTDLDPLASGSVPAYGTMLAGGPFFLAGARNADAGSVSLMAYRPQDGVAVESVAQFEIAGADMKRLAMSTCKKAAFLVEGNDDLFLRGIPLGAGAPPATRISTGHSGQGVYYEPYTETVLAPFSQGDRAELSAFKATGEGPSLKLTKREADWKVPTDLRLSIVATQDPYAIDCKSISGGAP